MLYQRYFLRMNQQNITNVLSILLAMVLSLAVVNIVFLQIDDRNGVGSDKMLFANNSIIILPNRTTYIELENRNSHRHANDGGDTGFVNESASDVSHPTYNRRQKRMHMPGKRKRYGIFLFVVVMNYPWFL